MLFQPAVSIINNTLSKSRRNILFFPNNASLIYPSAIKVSAAPDSYFFYYSWSGCRTASCRKSLSPVTILPSERGEGVRVSFAYACANIIWARVSFTCSRRYTALRKFARQLPGGISNVFVFLHGVIEVRERDAGRGWHIGTYRVRGSRTKAGEDVMRLTCKD